MFLLILSCSRVPEIEPAQTDRVANAAGMAGWTRAPLDPVEGTVVDYATYTLRPVSLQVFDGYRVSAALWLPKEAAVAGVLMAHGHFGQGKSSGEAQGPAHVLAHNGYAVLAVDTPGVEEGERADRAIHFEAGASNRGLLWSHGSSAMALQLHGLQAGLDFLGRHADRLGVAGASGGAVQALYLLLVDPRPEVAALASMVSIPREARASGCPCDVLPGWEGPDPALLAAIPRPVLWMTEVEGTPRPEGLASRVDYQVHPGAHGFEAPMRQAMLVFFGKHLGGGTEAIEPPYTPQESLASDSVGERGLGQLVAALPEQGLLPVRQASGPAWTLDCQGSGPRVLTLGVEAEDSEALEGFERCAITLRLDELGPTQGIVTGRPYADAIASSLVAAAGEDPLYAVGPWAVPVSRSGLVYVARDPLQEPTHSDPEWVHLPGFWDHGRYAEALAVSADPRELAEALQKR